MISNPNPPKHEDSLHEQTVGTFQDVTRAFLSSVNDLPPGIMVSAPDADLWFYLSSLEILDSKMDCRLIQDSNQSDLQFDVLNLLEPAETLGVLDQMFGAEMAWHEGYSLSQTLFSCHYIDSIFASNHPNTKSPSTIRLHSRQQARLPILLEVTRLYCLATILFCGKVINVVRRCGFHEEEDVSSGRFQRNMFARLSTMELILAIEDTCRELTLLSDAFAKQGDVETSAIFDALRERLLVRQLLLQPGEIDEDDDASSWIQSWSMLEHKIKNVILPSHSKAVTVWSSFSPVIQARLAPSVPPKPVVVKEFREAVEIFAQICTQCREAPRILAIPVADFLGRQIFIQNFMRHGTREPDPFVYPRACLFLLIWDHSSEFSTFLVLSQIRALVLPGHEVIPPDILQNWEEKERQFPAFYHLIGERVHHCTIPYLRALFQNKSRAHRILIGDVMCRSISFLNWTWDQDAISQTNAISDAISRWANLTMYELITEWLESGFRLDLYQPRELGMLYFVWGFVLEEIVDHLRDISESHKAIIGSNNEVEDQPSNEFRERMWSITYIESQIEMRSGEVCITTALSQLYSWLIGIGLISLPKLPTYNLRRQFEIRMRPLLQAYVFHSTTDLMNWDVIEHYMETEEAYSDLAHLLTDLCHQATAAISHFERAIVWVGMLYGSDERSTQGRSVSGKNSPCENQNHEDLLDKELYSEGDPDSRAKDAAQEWSCETPITRHTICQIQQRLEQAKGAAEELLNQTCVLDQILSHHLSSMPSSLDQKPAPLLVAAHKPSSLPTTACRTKTLSIPLQDQETENLGRLPTTEPHAALALEAPPPLLGLKPTSSPTDGHLAQFRTALAFPISQVSLQSQVSMLLGDLQVQFKPSAHLAFLIPSLGLANKSDDGKRKRDGQ